MEYEELKEMVSRRLDLPSHMENLHFAVAGIVYHDSDRNRIILGKRAEDSRDEGAKWEGIGGMIVDGVSAKDLLKQRLETKLVLPPGGKSVIIDRFFDWQCFTFTDDESHAWDWIVATYECYSDNKDVPAPDMLRMIDIRAFSLAEALALPAAEASPWTTYIAKQLLKRKSMESAEELKRLLALCDEQIGEDAAKGANIAVGSLVFNSEGKCLLLKRSESAGDEIGKYEGVGGRVEPGEGFSAALKRELHEELCDRKGQSLCFDSPRFFDWNTFRFSGANGEVVWAVVTYVVKLLEGDAVPNEDTAKEVKWFTLDELIELDPACASPWTIHVRDAYTRRFGFVPPT